MSLNIGELVAYIKIDHSGVGAGFRAAQNEMRRGMDGLAREAKMQGARAGQGAGQEFTSGFGRQTAKLRDMVLGSLAVGAVVSGLGRMKDAASDLNETTSMAGVIFGRSTDEMKRFAETGPRALGLSTEATLRFSAGLADMLLQLGYTQDAATATSRSTLQMAADLGSFKNLETADVLERINAGLRGEYDSLQLLIPNINAARVEKEALAASGKTVATQLTAEEKAAATLAIIQKDGARASGDFARTRNGEANASKTAAAEAANLAAEFGEKLLPAYTALVVFGRDEALPFLEDSIRYLEATGDAARPVAGAIGDVVKVFRDLPGPLQEATLGIIALVALRSRVEAFGASVQGRLSSAGTAGSKALDGLRLSIMYASETAESRAGRFAAVTKAIGASAGSGLRGAAGGLVGLLGGPWGVAFTGAVTVLGAYISKQKEAQDRVESMKDALDKQTGAITENNEALVIQELQAQGVLRAAESLGINLKDVTGAILDQAGARKRLNEQLTVADQFSSTDPEAIERQGNAILKVRDAVGGQNRELRKAQEEWRLENEAKTDSVDTTNQATDAQAGFGRATGDATVKVVDQAQALRDAAQAVLDLYDAQIAASDAEISYQQSLSAGAEILKEYGKKLPENAKAFDLTTEAGQRAQSALNDLARDTKAKTEQDVEAGKSLKSLREQMKDSRADFIELATKLGLSKTAANAMADEFGLTKKAVDKVAEAADKLPAAKQIKVEAETRAAKAALAALKEQLAGLKKTGIVVTATGRYTTEQSSSGGRNLGGGSTMADGGILRFADGTEDHRAFIAKARPGHVRVFAEPETGGEAYIPLSPAKRSRSAGILGQVADEFGYDLVPAGARRGPAPVTHSTTQITNIDVRQLQVADYSGFEDHMAEQERRHNRGGL